MFTKSDLDTMVVLSTLAKKLYNQSDGFLSASERGVHLTHDGFMDMVNNGLFPNTINVKNNYDDLFPHRYSTKVYDVEVSCIATEEEYKKDDLNDFEQEEKENG